MTDTSTNDTDRFTEELRYCECWEGKTLHTDRPRDSDDGRVRCQWCGRYNLPLSSTGIDR